MEAVVVVAVEKFGDVGRKIHEGHYDQYDFLSSLSIHHTQKLISFLHLSCSYIHFYLKLGGDQSSKKS